MENEQKTNEAIPGSIRMSAEEERPSDSACKRFTFTLNNPTDGELRDMAMVRPGGDISFLVGGYERGEGGTPHIQGYLECIRRMRMRQVRLLYPWMGRAAMFPSRGSRLQNYQYCTKDGDVRVQIGEVPKHAQRSDLDTIKELVDSGSTELEIADAHFSTWARNYRAVRVYMGLKRKIGAVFEAKEVKVYWGGTGTGKTRSVHGAEPAGGLWNWSGGNWFDGYSGQEAVLFDDFDVNSGIAFRFLLRLLDGYPLDVPVKGGFVPWFPKRVYFTSNTSWEQWYPLEIDVTPLKRRITTITHFN